MRSQPCLSQDIIEINRNKEYTLISTELLENVLTDARLNAQASKLWQVLFNKARYNANLEIKISYRHLAKQLDKSTRTIARYIETLHNAGYLIIQHNFDKKGGQRPSTLSVRVPTTFIEQAKKKKDRANKKYLVINETLLEQPKEEHEPISKEQLEDRPIYVPLAQCSDGSDVLRGTTSNTNDVETAIGHEPENGANVIDLVESDPGPASDEVPSKQDKNDMGGYDINGILKDNNTEEINNNNSTVVVFSGEDQKIISTQNEIAGLQMQLSDGDAKLSTIKDSSLLYDQIRKNSQIEASLELARIKLEKVKNIVNEKAKQNKMLQDLYNPQFMLNKAGARAVSSFTFKRLIKALISYGYRGNRLHVLINEIVFEARFGSLINCNKTQKSLSLDKAINIGLKLVREKRWSTPSLLKFGQC